MAELDPKKAQANVTLARAALRKAATPDKDGNTARVGFAFAPGKDKNDHILLIDPRKRAQALMSEIAKEHKDRKARCCGTATVVKDGGKLTLSIRYVKKLGGAERKIQEALKAMALQYVVKLEREDEDIVEEIADKVEEALEDQHSALADHDAADDEDEDDEAEEEDDDEEAEVGAEAAAGASAGAAAPTASAKPKPPSGPAATKLALLGAAPQVWMQTRTVMSKSIDQLRDVIRKEYASHPPEVLADIEKGMEKMGQVTARFDHRLAEAMEKASTAKGDAARKAELAKAMAILTEHIKYVQAEPMIAHIDANPFGVQTNLKKVLTASLTHMAKVIS